jgi:hypothetical protein
MLLLLALLEDAAYYKESDRAQNQCSGNEEPEPGPFALDNIFGPINNLDLL